VNEEFEEALKQDKFIDIEIVWDEKGIPYTPMIDPDYRNYWETEYNWFVKGQQAERKKIEGAIKQLMENIHDRKMNFTTFDIKDKIRDSSLIQGWTDAIKILKEMVCE